MSEYVTVNCIEACPRCKHKIRMEFFGFYKDDTEIMYKIRCDYMKNIIISKRTECNGMFEPKEVQDA